MISIFAIGKFGNLRLLTAEQPTKDVSSNPPLEPSLPAEPSISREQGKMQDDPLYQSIREQLKAGRESLNSDEKQTAIAPRDNLTNSLSPAQLQAVELILRAARILEHEKDRLPTSDTNNRSAMYSSTVKQLRLHAIQIINEASKP